MENNPDLVPSPTLGPIHLSPTREGVASIGVFILLIISVVLLSTINLLLWYTPLLRDNQTPPITPSQSVALSPNKSPLRQKCTDSTSLLN